MIIPTTGARTGGQSGAATLGASVRLSRVRREGVRRGYTGRLGIRGVSLVHIGRLSALLCVAQPRGMGRERVHHQLENWSDMKREERGALRTRLMNSPASDYDRRGVMKQAPPVSLAWPIGLVLPRGPGARVWPFRAGRLP